MPELPEVETMRRGIAPVAGCRIRAVERPRCRLRPVEITPDLKSWHRRVRGAEITEVGRIGKRVVLSLSGGDRIVFEPRMTGLVLLAAPPNTTHLRLRLTLEGGPPELLFWDRRGLGKVRLLAPDKFDAWYGPAQLGPDALTISVDELRGRLERSQRPIKVALLDQKRVAGIGNLYASEILHAASLHPERPCQKLKADDWRRVHVCMRQILETAVLYEGSTLSDGTYRNALNQEGGYQNHHRVYDKADEVCLRCRQGVVRRIVQAQRATFFCPVCQPRSQRSAHARPR
ncbi:MAG: formamidopyrimidine-DNA glycosylase [Planctomycetaceae bacterium]|nr:formamidopyrimidine-DNA glycosylase [Planctomycetaceae bacterium]